MSPSNNNYKASYEYLPALDGLRAVSILLVVLSHCGMGMEKILPGSLGVTIFFVISGFLITRQMIAEIEAKGTLNIKKFYIRRVLRLLPPLLLYLTIFVPALLYLGASITLTHIVSGVFYFANYYHIFTGYPPYNPMPILWSLSVEEHYYIVFPFIMLLCRERLPALLPFIVLAMFAVFLWRAVLYNICFAAALSVCGVPGAIRAQATDAIFDCILYGVFIALALHYYSKKVFAVLITRDAFLLALLFLLLSLIVRDGEFRATLRYSVQAASSAVIILNVLFGKVGALKTVLENKWVVLIGKLSYSLYLMHFGALITIEAIHHTRYLQNMQDVAFYLCFSFLLAGISYFLIEKTMTAIRHQKRLYEN